MQKRNIILLAIGSLVVTAFGSVITYYDHQAADLQQIVVEPFESYDR